MVVVTGEIQAMTEKNNGWGGVREGAGRKVGWRKGFSEERKQRQVRAHEDEWELIKEFVQIVKKDKERAQRILKTE